VRDLSIYELNAENELLSVTRAADAVFQPKEDHWRLSGLEIQRLSEQGVGIEIQQQSNMQGLLSPAMLDVVAIAPESMSIADLSSYVDYLESNGLEARKYEQAMWSKLVSPFATLVMVLLAVPFIFGSQRTMTAGHRILIGTMVGIGFHLLSQIFGYVGLVYEMNPVAAALTPTLVFFFAAIHLLRKVH
jgi:lipopolysaccharide export system permease protein